MFVVVVHLCPSLLRFRMCATIYICFVLCRMLGCESH